jgi:hypothetical protein
MVDFSWEYFVFAACVSTMFYFTQRGLDEDPDDEQEDQQK